MPDELGRAGSIFGRPALWEGDFFPQRCDDDDEFLNLAADVIELGRLGDAAPHQPIVAHVVEACFRNVYVVEAEAQ